jgi:hypothetical protein
MTAQATIRRSRKGECSRVFLPAVVLSIEMEKKNARIQTLEEAVQGLLLPKIDWVNNPGE